MHFTGPVSRTLYLCGVFLLPPFLGLLSTWIVRNIREYRPKYKATVVGSALRYLGSVFFIALPSCVVTAVIVHYTGQLLGAGEHAARWAGSGGSTGMHVLSYFIGVPAAVALLWAVAYRKGGIVERYLMRLTPSGKQQEKN
jgi:hypothetical protein